MDFESEVKTKYPYLSMEQCVALVRRAKGLYYMLRYPNEPYVTEEDRPLNTIYAQTAVLLICDEIAERNGFNSALGFRENGYSLTYDSAWLSKSIKDLITPVAWVL